MHFSYGKVMSKVWIDPAIGLVSSIFIYNSGSDGEFSKMPSNFCAVKHNEDALTLGIIGCVNAID